MLMSKQNYEIGKENLFCPRVEVLIKKNTLVIDGFEMNRFWRMQERANQACVLMGEMLRKCQPMHFMTDIILSILQLQKVR